jgi:hypothetical protein
MASPTSPNRQVALGTLQRAGFISSRRGRIQVDGCGLEEASCECYWAIRLTSSALISILFWRTGRSRTTTEGSRRPLAAGRADGTPGVYVPNNSFPGLGTVHRTMQFSQRTYRKYGVRSITRRCVSCPQVAHGARWTRSRRRSIGVPVSVACSGFRGPSGSRSGWAIGISARPLGESDNEGTANASAAAPESPRRVQLGAPGPFDSKRPRRQPSGSTERGSWLS